MVGLRSIASALVGALAAVTLAACAADPSPRQESRAAGAAPALNAGGVLGGAIGGTLDERDRQRAYAAEIQALEQGEPGEPVGWRGDGPKRYGTVVPGAPYETRGTRCRDYSHTIYIDGRPQTARTTACRNPDGSWAPAG